MKEGAVTFSTYVHWVRSGSPRNLTLPTFLFIIALFAVSQGTKIFADLWLGRGLGLPIYFVAIAVMFVLMLFRSLALVSLAARASRTLHDGLMASLLSAPVNLFFDVTPTGRILNRLSADLDNIDTRLPETVLLLLNSLFVILGSLVMAVYASPWFLVLLAPLFVLFFGLVSRFASTSRQIKRIESVSRSPLFSHFGETLAGLATVRAFNRVAQFRAVNAHLVDTNARAHLAFWMVSRFFALRADLISVLAQIGIALLVVSTTASPSPVLIANSPAVMGLAIVYALQLTTTLQACSRYFTETETTLVGCERIREMTEDIPRERRGGSPPTFKTPPGHGAVVEFINVSARYRPHLDLALRGVTFRVEAGKRCGVCGRTGSGKSSLGSLLFGMLTVEPGGRLLVDGMDTSTLDLQAMRKCFAVIPQQPVIFSGTLRSALDPWGEATDDAKLWAALESVSMADVARAMGNGLDSVVDESGANFSVGERQLLCIARALLRDARVVLVDEGTANVDVTSDQIVQRALRDGFRGATTFTIAHRLATLVHSDVIVVLDRGELKEMGAPAELIAKRGGWFAKMWEEETKGRSSS